MEDRISSDAASEIETMEMPDRVVDSVTLARLLEEVRNVNDATAPTAYNRMHNRHNRS